MASEEEKVSTVKQARILSLRKWDNVCILLDTFFDEIDRSCGFCELGRYRSHVQRQSGMGCQFCGVRDRCKQIQSTASDLETQMRDLVTKTIKYLEDMKVIENAD